MHDSDDAVNVIPKRYEELINVHCNVYRRAAAFAQQSEYAASRKRQQLRQDGWKFGRIGNPPSRSAEVFVPSLAIELEQSLAERHQARETGKPYENLGHVKNQGL